MNRPLSLRDVLDRLAVHPILVDVGASAGAPPTWDPIARNSVYIGFDPDTRELPDSAGDKYFKNIVVNRAVTAAEGETTPFYFTKSPYCSSTLPPNRDALAAYSFAPLFEVVNESVVESMTLNRVLDQHAPEGLDWLKLDTQGTDLRIFQSLRPHYRQRVLAVDVEPGLIDAYDGEDLFVDVHRELTSQGFWLSDLNVGTAVRLSRAGIAGLQHIDPKLDQETIERHARRSPAWCEARYLRTQKSIAVSGLGKREHLLLAIFAMVDRQWGFAFETVVALERAFEADDLSVELKQACAEHLREPQVRGFRRLQQLLGA